MGTTGRSLDWSRAMTLLLLVGSGVSGVATFTGLGQFMGVGPLEVTIAAALTVLIQGTILAALEAAVARPEVAGRGRYLLAYAAALTISVIFAYGFWFERVGSEEHARASYRAQVGNLLEPLVGFEQAYADLAHAAQDVAAYSRARAEEEARVGGTCGGPKLVGEGSRARLRQRDAAAASSFAEHFARRSADVEDLVRKVEASVASFGEVAHSDSVRVADYALARAQALARDPKIEAWRTHVRERLDSAARGFVDAETGARFTCPDAALETKLQGALAMTLPALPAERGRFFEATREDSVRRGFAFMMGAAGLADNKQAFVPERDGLAFGIALINDALLLLLAWIKRTLGGGGRGSGLARLGQRLRGRPSLPDGWQETWTDALDFATAKSPLEVLQGHLLKDGHVEYLVVPVDRDAPDAAAVERLADLLVALGRARRPMIQRVEVLPEWWRERCRRALAGTRSVLLYRLRGRLFEKLVLEDVLAHAGAGRSGARRPALADLFCDLDADVEPQRPGTPADGSGEARSGRPARRGSKASTVAANQCDA